MKQIFAFLLAGLFTLSPASAWAGENEMMDALIHKLVEKGVLTREEGWEIKKEVAEEAAGMAKGRESEAKDAASKMAGGSWLKTVKWKGDLRLRHETQKRAGTDRLRERFRLRFGFTAKPIEPLEIGVRLATGTSGDPVSTNQSFDTSFDKKAIFVDQAYATYKALEWLSVTGGKMENPYWLLPEGLVWDSDVTPEGAVVQLKSPTPLPILDEFVKVTPFASAGGYVIDEISGDEGDPGLFGYQGGATVEGLPFDAKWTTAIAYYDYTGIDGRRTSDITNATAGNSTSGSAAIPIFGNDYDLVNVSSELKIPLPFECVPQMVLMGDFVHNPTAQDHQSGHMVGVNLGKVTDKLGSWEAFYHWKYLEPDAVFGALTDSDFGGGGTNHRGHIMGARMGLNKYAAVSVKYFRTEEVRGTNAHVDTLQADLQLKY
ncbi:MAG: putative porin [Candidatus Omnitrophica bacterium]|nr:putative porin [Candidatus Omnitrophota bacterium]